MRILRPRVTNYMVPVHSRDPIGIAYEIALTNRDLRGTRSGATRIGWPSLGLRNDFKGYAAPPQLFVGYSATKVAGGALKGSPGGLPGTQAPPGYISPLLAAAATISSAQGSI
jgi:hypothetical protein